jgi:sulfur transfer complex TusBCD TusB component (DsrH family)
MIKLFRTIRQAMIKESKVSKYLQYAIGEIVLVVIGILIALQINTWNQNRINNSLEKGYYERFLNDVYFDEEIVTQQMEVTKIRILGANNMLGILQKKSVDLDSLSKEIRKCIATANFNFKPTQITYEDIKSSGNLYLLRDLGLKNKIDQHYSDLSGIMTTINTNSAKLADRVLLKEDLIGTGFANIVLSQNGINPAIVDKEKLKSLIHLSEKNRMLLMNDAILYLGISSRNLQHFEKIIKELNMMKSLLEAKCKSKKQ